MVFMTPDEEEYNLWSLAKTMKYGWLFRTPVWGRYGNGYIFDSDFVKEDEAKKELEDLFGKEINIGKKFSFDPGYLDKTWINNCVAIGLSSSFVEPLEASSIGASIQQAFLLTHNISNYSQKSIDFYNKSVKDIVLNIRDFLVLHYQVDKNDSLFWESLKDLPIPDSLQDRLDVWKQRLPIREDFSGLSDYILFKDQHFLMILNGLQLLDVEAVKKEYSFLAPDLKELADLTVFKELARQNNANLTSHKQFLSLLRQAR
jgi:tryptophan halogenase